jgi:outer membrane lipoprotein carrier protein
MTLRTGERQLKRSGLLALLGFTLALCCLNRVGYAGENRGAGGLLRGACEVSLWPEGGRAGLPCAFKPGLGMGQGPENPVGAAIEEGRGSASEKPSANSDSLEQIAAKVRASYEKLQGLSMSFRQINSWADMPEPGEVSKGKLWAARGGKLRMEYTEPPGHLLVSDGRRVWVYVPENKQAVVDSMGRDGQSALAEMLLQDLDESHAKLVGEERADGRNCYVILVKDLEDPPGLEWLKIWIDRRSWLTCALELRDINENVTKFSFSDIRKLTKIDEDLFKFEAPPGIEVVESPLSERRSR